jgi:hypothetical protein
MTTKHLLRDRSQLQIPRGVGLCAAPASKRCTLIMWRSPA